MADTGLDIKYFSGIVADAFGGAFSQSFKRTTHSPLDMSSVQPFHTYFLNDLNDNGSTANLYKGQIVVVTSDDWKDNTTYVSTYSPADDATGRTGPYLVYGYNSSSGSNGTYYAVRIPTTPEINSLIQNNNLSNTLGVGEWYQLTRSADEFDRELLEIWKNVDMGFDDEQASRFSYGEIFNDYVENVAMSYAHAEGYHNKALAYGSHVEGIQNLILDEADATHVEGSENMAYGLASHVEGFQNYSEGDYSHSEGVGTYAMNEAVHVEGFFTTADGISAHAEGSYTTAIGDYSHSGGIVSLAEGEGSFAHGNLAYATGIYSVAMGGNVSSSNEYSFGEGYNTTSSGVASHAEGHSSTASGNYSHSEGRETEASGINSHTEGKLSIASGESSHAEGDNTTSSGVASHSEGRSSKASGNYSHSEGYRTTASNYVSHAEGQYTVASGEASHASGRYTYAIGDTSFASGIHTYASYDYSFASGFYTYAYAIGSHTEGAYTTTYGVYSHAEGHKTIASGLYSHSEGSTTTASGSYSHTEGSSTTASGSYSHAEGSSTTASGSYSHAENDHTQALGIGSHAEGSYTIASGNVSHAEGYASYAFGQYSHAEGYNVEARGEGSHAEGASTKANGNYSHTEGAGTTASGDYSHTEGANTVASGQYAHAGGSNAIAHGVGSFSHGVSTYAIGDYSFAIGSSSYASYIGSFASGSDTQAYGPYSHVEGSLTTTYGDYSHAEGYKTKASGNSSHVEGNESIASGDYSHAEGYKTEASGQYSHAGGGSSHAEGEGSFAHGVNAYAIGDYSFAVGSSTYAAYIGSFASGVNTNAYADYSHSEGSSTTTYGQYSHVEGVNNIGYKTAIGSHIEGSSTYTSGPYSHVQNLSTHAFNEAETSIGQYNRSYDPDSDFLYRTLDTHNCTVNADGTVTYTSNGIWDGRMPEGHGGGGTLFTIGDGTGTAYEDGVASEYRHNVLEIHKDGAMVKTGSTYFRNDVFGPVSFTYVESLGPSAYLTTILSALLSNPKYTKPVVGVAFGNSNSISSFSTNSSSTTVDVGTLYTPYIRFRAAYVAPNISDYDPIYGTWLGNRLGYSEGVTSISYEYNNGSTLNTMLTATYTPTSDTKLSGINNVGDTYTMTTFNRGLTYSGLQKWTCDDTGIFSGALFTGSTINYINKSIDSGVVSNYWAFKDSVALQLKNVTIGTESTYTIARMTSYTFAGASKMYFQQLAEKSTYVMNVGMPPTSIYSDSSYTASNNKITFSINGRYRVFYGTTNDIPTSAWTLTNLSTGSSGWIEPSTGDRNITLSTSGSPKYVWFAIPSDGLGSSTDSKNVSNMQDEKAASDNDVKTALSTQPIICRIKKYSSSSERYIDYKTSAGSGVYDTTDSSDSGVVLRKITTTNNISTYGIKYDIYYCSGSAPVPTGTIYMSYKRIK